MWVYVTNSTGKGFVGNPQLFYSTVNNYASFKNL